ncbi:hypothetical protein Cgig2_033821 [Carnegiea gigantea]|uniref:DUF4283 domain-containing protein n=1 Tax=Carnegiea gigantea TaxID=171969 RepID=A0A9Q1Q731_9CARY|nr:hypothetical protein Cgig2_033821 [Carnegiea gigantea]
MKNVLKNTWKPSKVLVVRGLDCNLFVFQFLSQANKNFILSEHPWVFDALFWVKSYDVPKARHTKYFVKFLGSQVDTDVRRPPSRGVRIKMKDKTIWIPLKFVKHPNFCYEYGRIGHVPKNYEVCGAWLRASSLKTRRGNIKTELQKEKMLLLALRRERGNYTRKKLALENTPRPASKWMKNKSSIMGDPENIVIDNLGAITPSNKAFKHKLGGEA